MPPLGEVGHVVEAHRGDLAEVVRSHAVRLGLECVATEEGHCVIVAVNRRWLRRVAKGVVKGVALVGIGCSVVVVGPHLGERVARGDFIEERVLSSPRDAPDI